MTSQFFLLCLRMEMPSAVHCSWNFFSANQGHISWNVFLYKSLVAMVICGWNGRVSILILYKKLFLKNSSVDFFTSFSWSFGDGAMKIVLGLKAEKLLVEIEKGVSWLLKELMSAISCGSFSASIQNGGMSVIWAGDFNPTLQLYFSSIRFLYFRTFSLRSWGSTMAMKYICM